MEIKQGTDNSMLLLAVCLTCLGVVMVFSSSSIMAVRAHADSLYFLKRQGLFALVGFGFLTAMIHFDYQHFRKLAVPLLIFCVLLLVLVLVPGVGKKVGGAVRWLR
ncbi:MAG: FtsW/RodA/SpoVE family cell cycle protein, partial [Desulfuromonadales bacterium]|nr:FtsW/RodA/SpoVE family cell cycle protein [Desulfuromonadales bacterium]